MALLFIVPVIDLLTASMWRGSPFPDNFILVIFKLHAHISGVREAALEVLRPLDITVMVLFSVVSFALYAALKVVSRFWAAGAAALTPIGLMMYLITEETGRSGIIAGSLVFSVLMLKGGPFGRLMASLGLSASTLLLIADGAIGFGFMEPFAVIMGVGYGLFVLWLFGLTWRLLSLRHALPGDSVAQA